MGETRIVEDIRGFGFVAVGDFCDIGLEMVVEFLVAGAETGAGVSHQRRVVGYSGALEQIAVEQRVIVGQAGRVGKQGFRRLHGSHELRDIFRHEGAFSGPDRNHQRRRA